MKHYFLFLSLLPLTGLSLDLLAGPDASSDECKNHWLDGRYFTYRLLWEDPVPEERMEMPFTRETFEGAGWLVSSWNKKHNDRFGSFAKAPDGTPAIEVLYPAMSDWSSGGIGITTGHFKEHPPKGVLYAYSVMLEVNPSDFTIEENTSGIISGKLAGLYSQNMDLGRIPSKQKGWVTREVWRGRTDKGPFIGSYDYHLNRTDSPDETTYGKPIGENKTIQPGKWVTIVRELVLNDPGIANGKSRLWIDGQLVADREDLLYSSAPEYALQGFRFLTFCGGSHPWLVNTDWRIWFRGFQLWVPQD